MTLKGLELTGQEIKVFDMLQARLTFVACLKIPTKAVSGRAWRRLRLRMGATDSRPQSAAP
jgi:hypothetical protein